MKTLWNYFSFPIIRRWLSSSSNETYLNFFSHAESRTKEKEKEEGSKKCWCLVNAITFRFRRVDFWLGGGGEKPAFERSCYEYRNKRGAREKREYDEYEAVIKVKVAFRVIRDCCSNDDDSSVCTKDDTCSVSRARANTWKDIGCVLVTSHESSTDNDSVNGESVQSCRSNRRQTRRWNRGCRRMREGEGGRWERESLGERLLSLTRGEGKMTGRMLINQPRVLFGLWHEAAPPLSPQKMFTLREDALIELKRRVE